MNCGRYTTELLPALFDSHQGEGAEALVEWEGCSPRYAKLVSTVPIATLHPAKFEDFPYPRCTRYAVTVFFNWEIPASPRPERS